MTPLSPSRIHRAAARGGPTCCSLLPPGHLGAYLVQELVHLFLPCQLRLLQNPALCRLLFQELDLPGGQEGWGQTVGKGVGSGFHPESLGGPPPGLDSLAPLSSFPGWEVPGLPKASGAWLVGSDKPRHPPASEPPYSVGGGGGAGLPPQTGLSVLPRPRPPPAPSPRPRTSAGSP